MSYLKECACKYSINYLYIAKIIYSYIKGLNEIKYFS